MLFSLTSTLAIGQEPKQPYIESGYEDSNDSDKNGDYEPTYHSVGAKHQTRRQLGTVTEFKGAPQARRPVDACLIASDAVVLVACQRSGEVLAIDDASGDLIDTIKIARQPVAIERLPDGSIWVVDQANDAIIEVRFEDRKLYAGRTIKTVRSPVAIAPAGTGKLAVAGLWSRKVSLVTMPSKNQASQTLWTCDLEFSPLTMRLLSSEDIVLAVDAFGSQIAYLDASSGKHLRQTEFYGHKIRGMIDDIDGKRLIVSHQMLNSAAQSSNNDIHWGMMVSNDLRWLDRQQILASQESEFYKNGHIDPIGIVGQGGADPNDIARTPDGIVVVPLGGVNEVAIGQEEFYELARVPVGTNPVAITLDRNGNTCWVVNRLEDSLTKIDLRKRSVLQTVRLSKNWQPTTADLGERLFHDASLAHDGWMSCASCHPGGHAINERADNLSDGKYQSPKRVLSLLGRADTAPFGWIGGDETLAGQLRRSVKTTMQGSHDLTDEQVTQLTAFLRTLSPPPSVLDLKDPAIKQSVRRGKAIFQREQCGDCHGGKNYTSKELFDVGLEDELGNKQFNPPSLLGIGQRGPRFFHDLRAESLSQVFTEFGHSLRKPLPKTELSDLLIFLRSL